MTDLEIEQAVTRAGGKWDGSRWVFEDADLHPFARTLLAAERERCATELEDMAENWPDVGAALRAASNALRA